MTKNVRFRRPRILMIEGASFTASFVSNLAKAMFACGKYDIDVLGYSDPVGIPLHNRRESIYSKVFYYPDPPSIPKGLHQTIELASALLSPIAVPDALAREPRGIEGYAFRKAYIAQLRRLMDHLVGSYDMYHWHCFDPQNLPVLDALRADAKLILTLWGSDIYRTYGVAEYQRQFRVARRVSVVTTATPELADTFMSKFGRDLGSKIRIVSYGTKFVEVIARFHGERAAFLRSVGIDPLKITVVVGNNALPETQHEGVLRELAKLPKSLLCQLAILIPMTYTGNSPEYVNSIRRCAERQSLNIRIIDQRLSDDDVARLRVATDILIHVPISDQFSAAMCESLVAGAILITGGWLPYRKLRASGVQYHEVSDMGEIATKLADILSRFEAERVRTEKNSDIVRELVSWRTVVPQWERVYDELLGPGIATDPAALDQ